jgi:c-di-GMP phosphodiesterase
MSQESPLPISVVIARQPILSRDHRLYAYELLTRGDEGRVLPDDGSVTTSSVLIGALAEFGLDRLVGEVPAFINVTTPFVTNALPLPISPKQVVLEVLESVEPSRETIAGLARLKQLGFRIALDDYAGSRKGYEPFLQLADIVKVDCKSVAPEALADVVAGLRAFRARLLAEKVEDHETYRACRELGFELFQGFYFARPEVSRARAPSADRSNLMHLLSELNRPDVELEDLEGIISRDAALSFKLLRVLNSANFGLAREVSTVGEMLRYLGPAIVRDIASLLLLARCDDKPRPLLLLAMLRARTCQRLAGLSKPACSQRAFMVGLFSALDAILDVPIEAALAPLPLSEEVRTAIVHKRGELGLVLETAIALEQGKWDAPSLSCFASGDLQQVSFDSAVWVTEIERQTS